MGTDRIVGGLALAALLLSAGVARAETEEEILRELRALRQRVNELEAWKAEREARDAQPDALARAIEGYLASREDVGPSGGIVRAPRSRSLELGGMVRVRGEMLRRTPQPPDRDGQHTNEYVLGRVRLHARARIADDLAAFVELQDARVWGEEASTAADGDGVDLSQGYLDFEDVWDDTDARLGRQAVSLSDQRFIGALEWANPGRRFDGLTVNHRRDGARYTAFAYRLADGFATGDVSDDDSDLFGLWATYPGPAGLGTVELFGIWRNDTADRPGEPRPGRVPREGHLGYGTYGIRVHGADDEAGFDWDLQAALQDGEIGGDDLRAWAARGQAGLRLGDGPHAPRLGAEWNYATGDRDPTDGDVDQFQVLFPTNHGYYGIHDLAAWSNTNAWSVNASAQLAENVTLQAAYWRFRLAEEEGGWVVASGRVLRPGVRDAGRSLGHETDLVVTWKQSDRVTWQLGWAHFWAGAFARQTEPDGNATDSDFFYLQTLVTF